MCFPESLGLAWRPIQSLSCCFLPLPYKMVVTLLSEGNRALQLGTAKRSLTTAHTCVSALCWEACSPLTTNEDNVSVQTEFLHSTEMCFVFSLQ